VVRACGHNPTEAELGEDKGDQVRPRAPAPPRPRAPAPWRPRAGLVLIFVVPPLLRPRSRCCSLICFLLLPLLTHGRTQEAARGDVCL
jgi:hypothetical protein